MLYYHTKNVLRKQNLKREENRIHDDISDEDLEEADDPNSIDWLNWILYLYYI